MHSQPAGRLRRGLLATPINASHLNRIECHFWAYVELVINGSDYSRLEDQERDITTRPCDSCAAPT